MANPNSAQNFKEADFSDLERSILSCAFCHQGPIDDELCEGGRLYIYRPPGGAKAVAKAKKAALKRLQEQKKPKKKGRNNRNDEVITLDSSDFSDSDDEIDVDEGELCFHYFCVLFSAQIQQRGIRGSERNSIFAQNHAGLFGFLIDDILSEIERTKSNECHFCPSFNANIQCKKKGCKTKFHYQCGEGNGSQYVFSDDFPSYCPQHRIDFEKLLPKTKAFPVSDKTCLCCLEKVTVPLKHLLPKFSSPDFLVSPCCGRTFHRLCIQKLAITEGSARFQCPNCEEQSLFGLSMRRCGIYVPIRETVSQESPGSRRPGRNGNGHSPSPRGRGRGRGRGAAPASSGNARPPGPASRGRPSGPASRGRGMAPPSRGPSSSRSSTSPAPLPKLTVSKGNRGSWKASIHDDSDEEFNLDSVMKEVNASPKRRNSRNVSKPARFRSPNAVNMSDDDDDEEEFIPKGPPKSFDAISSPGRPSPRTRGPPPKISPSLKYKKYRDLSSDSSRSPSPEVIAMPSPRTTPSRGRGRGRGRGSRSSAPSPASSVGSGSVTSVTPSSRPGPKSRSSRSSRASTPDPLDDVPLSRSGRGRRAGPSPKAAPRQPPKPSPRTASRGKKTPAKKGSARRGKKDDFSSGESSDGGNFVEDLPTFDDADSDDYTPATVPTPSRTSRTRGKPTTSFAHLLLDDSDDEAPLSFNVNGKSSAKKTGPASKGDASPDILQSFRHSVVPSNGPGPASRKSDVSPPVFAKKTAPASRPGPKSRSAPKEPSPPPPSRGSRGRLGPKSRIAEREPSPEIKSTKTSRAGPKSRVPTPAARSVSNSRSPSPERHRSRYDHFYRPKSGSALHRGSMALDAMMSPDLILEKIDPLELGGRSGLAKKSIEDKRMNKLGVSKSGGANLDRHSMNPEVQLSRLDIRDQYERKKSQDSHSILEEGTSPTKRSRGRPPKMGPQSIKDLGGTNSAASPVEAMETEDQIYPRSRRNLAGTTSTGRLPMSKKVGDPSPEPVFRSKRGQNVPGEMEVSGQKSNFGKSDEREPEIRKRAGPKSKRANVINDENKPVKKTERPPSPVVVEFSSEDEDSMDITVPKKDMNGGIPQYIIDMFMSPTVKVKKMQENVGVSSMPKPGPKSKRNQVPAERIEASSKVGPKSRTTRHSSGEPMEVDLITKAGPFKSRSRTPIGRKTSPLSDKQSEASISAEPEPRKTRHAVQNDQRPGPKSKRNAVNSPGEGQNRQAKPGPKSRKNQVPAECIEASSKIGPKSRTKRHSSEETMEVDLNMKPGVSKSRGRTPIGRKTSPVSSKPGDASISVEHEMRKTRHAVQRPGPKSKRNIIESPGNEEASRTKPGPKSRSDALKGAQNKYDPSSIQNKSKAKNNDLNPVVQLSKVEIITSVPKPSVSQDQEEGKRTSRRGHATGNILENQSSNLKTGTTSRTKLGPKSKTEQSTLDVKPTQDVPVNGSGSRIDRRFKGERKFKLGPKSKIMLQEKKEEQNEQEFGKRQTRHGGSNNSDNSEVRNKPGPKSQISSARSSKSGQISKSAPRTKTNISDKEVEIPESPRTRKNTTSPSPVKGLGPKSKRIEQNSREQGEESNIEAEEVTELRSTRRNPNPSTSPSPAKRPGPKSKKSAEQRSRDSAANDEVKGGAGMRSTRAHQNDSPIVSVKPKGKLDPALKKPGPKSKRTSSFVQDDLPGFKSTRNNTTPSPKEKPGPKSKMQQDIRKSVKGKEDILEPRSTRNHPQATNAVDDDVPTRIVSKTFYGKSLKVNSQTALASKPDPKSKESSSEARRPGRPKKVSSPRGLGGDAPLVANMLPKIVLSRVNVPTSLFKQKKDNGIGTAETGSKRRRSQSALADVGKHPTPSKRVRVGNDDEVAPGKDVETTPEIRKRARGRPKKSPEQEQEKKKEKFTPAKTRSPSPANSVASYGSVRSNNSSSSSLFDSTPVRSTRARAESATPSKQNGARIDPLSPSSSSRASRKKSNEEDPLSLSAFDAVATGSTRRGARASAKAAPSNLGVDPLAITSEDLDLGTKSGRKGPAANGRPGPASRRGATPSSKDKFEEAFNKLKEDRAKSSVEPVTPGKRKRGEATPTSPKLPEKKIKAAMGPRSAMSKRKRQNSSDEEIVEIVEERKSSKPAPKRKQDGAAKPGPASARPGPKSQKPGPASRTSALKRKREPERQVDKKKARLELLACSKDVTNLVLEDILLATEEAMIKSKTFATETCSDWIKEDLLGSVFAESTQYCSTVMDDVVLDSLFVLFGPPSSFHVTEDKNADKYLLALKPPKVKVQDCVNTDKMPFDATAIFCRDILIDEVVYPAKKEVDSRFLNEMCKRVTGDIVEHALLDSTRHCAKNILEDIIFDEACYRAMGPPKTLDLKHEKAPKIIDKLKCTLPLQDMFTRPDGKFPTEANGIFCMDILVDEVVYPAKDEIDDRFIEGVAKGQVDTLLEMLFKESTQYCSTVLDKVVDEAGYRLFGPPNRLNLNHELAPMILEKTSKATLKVEDCFAKEPYPTEANFSFCMDILVEEAVYPAKEEIDANFMEKMCSGIVTHIVDDLVFAESAQYCQKELLEDTIMDEAAYRLFGPPLRLPLGHVKAPKILGKLQNHYLKIEDCIKKPQMPREAVKIICDDLMDEIVLNTEEEIISRPFFKYKQVNDAIIDTLVAMPMKWKTIREREKWRLSVIGDSIKSILLDVPKSDDFATRLTSTHKFAGDMCFQIMVEDVADSATKLFIERKEAREAELRRPKPFSIKCKDLYAEKKLHPEASRFLGETTVLSIVNDAEGVLAERPFFGKKLISDLLGSMVSESVAQAAHRKKEGSRKRGHSSSTSKSIGNSGNDLLFDSPAKRSRKTVIEEHDEESSITIVHDIKLECFSDSESSNASNTLRRKRKRSSVASNLKGEALFDSLFGGSASNGDSSGVGTNGVMSNENGESNGIEIIE